MTLIGYARVSTVGQDNGLETQKQLLNAFAIISRLNGVDVYDIMRSLGHEKIETTMIYLEKIFEKEKHAIHSWKSKCLGSIYNRRY